MKKSSAVLLTVFALLLVFLAFLAGKQMPSRASPDEIISVRDTVIDTIPYRMPIPCDSVVVRYSTVKLPTKDTVYLRSENDTVKIDSVAVEIPIAQKVYKDSTYKAWISGYNAILDSIYVFPKTITVSNRIRDAPQRWGLGIQVGVGYNSSNKFQPYIGVGVSYNILTW